MSYYQGMNYIVVFLYKIFQGNKNLTFKFFYFLTKNYLIKYFTKDFKGLIKLIFLCDKLMQICNGIVWKKLEASEVSTIHFGVPCLITIYTTLLKIQDFNSLYLISEIWDLFLAQGYRSLIKSILYCLELQQSHILDVDPDNLFLAMKDLEKDPMSVMKFKKVENRAIIDSYLFINKEHINDFEIDPKTFERLCAHYERIHKPILKFWSEE